MVVFPDFSPNKRRKLCFVINVLSNKTRQLDPTASSTKYEAIFRAISQDNC